MIAGQCCVSFCYPLKWISCLVVLSLSPARLFCMDCSPPDSSVQGISQAKILEWVAISFSRGSFWPRDPTRGSCIAGRFFTAEPPGKPESAMCIHISLFCWTALSHPPPHPPRSSQSPKLSSLHYIQQLPTCFLFTHGSVYMPPLFGSTFLCTCRRKVNALSLLAENLWQIWMVY